MKILFFILFYFLYIFGPVFNSIGPWADVVFFSSIIFIIMNTLFYKILFPRYLIPFFLIFFVYAYSILSGLFYSNYELVNFTEFILKPVRVVITVFGGYSLLSLSKKYLKNFSNTHTLFYIYISIILHGLIMILQFHYPDFKSYIYSYTMGGAPRSTFEYDFRMGGLSGSTGGAILSIVQSFGIILIPFLYKLTRSTKQKIFLLLSSTLILYSVFICGRSGIWSMIIFSFLSLLLLNATSLFKFFTISIKSIVITIFGITIVLILFKQLEENSSLFYALNRTFDTFIIYSESNNFDDKTVSTLQSHILLPNSKFTLFFGSTEVLVNTQFDRSLDSDIGYIRNLWGFGIFFTILYWLPIFYFFIIVIKLKKKSLLESSFIVISLIIILFHAKEITFYTRMLLSIYSLLLASIKFSNLEKSEISNKLILKE